MAVPGLLAARRAGVLLHPTSLPGPHGIGDLGDEAHAFARWLGEAGQSVWQVLPLGPTGYGDSPYQALSAFAGNPLLVSLDRLADEGLLDRAALAPWPPGPVDYGRLIPWRSAALASAAAGFRTRAQPARRAAFEDFRHARRASLDDLALFLALKAAAGGRPWWAWEAPLATRQPAALARARSGLAEAVEAHAFGQFAFEEQWAALRATCREVGVLLLGDLPIYPALDSAEVWAHPEWFHLDDAGAPTAVAGVPPDYFSATGQRWGNPLFRWEAMSAGGYAPVVERVREALRLVDALRLDHFRGYEAYWAVPAEAPTAEAGEWRPGPGARLFEVLAAVLGRPLPLVAEDLGVITPEVVALRRRFGLPGMAILQFAFGDDPQAATFLPHAYERATVAYTGTHDNDTVMAWWRGDDEGASRSRAQVEREREHARRYLATDGREMHWAMIRALLASVAGAAVVPLQDLLGLGTEGRMNRPATASGNWRWRAAPGAASPALAGRLGELTDLYGRAPGAGAA
jgi:4-alpha-glucanotransferase